MMEELESVKFGFFTTEEAHRVSVKEITSARALDDSGAAVPGGLYDPALGPTSRGIHCPTCNELDKTCSGHCGHIDLPRVCYQPLLFGQLYKVLQCKCLHCHWTRLGALEARWHACRIGLLARGAFRSAESFCPQPSQAIAAAKLDESYETAEAAKEAATSRCESLIQAAQAELSSAPAEADRGGGTDRAGAHARVARHEAIKAFWDALKTPNRCANCGAARRRIKKEGFTRFLALARSERASRMDAELGLDTRFKSATLAAPVPGASTPVATAKFGERNGDETNDDKSLIDDLSSSDADESPGDDSEDEASEAGAGNRQHLEKADDVVMDAGEVWAQMEALWARCGPVLAAVLGDVAPFRGDQRLGFRKFFLETVLVPPSRFRPSQKIGAVTAEHPQNVCLTRMLQIKERIRAIENPEVDAPLIQDAANTGPERDDDESGGDDDDDDAAAAAEAAAKEASKKKPAVAAKKPRAPKKKKERIDRDAHLPKEERIFKQWIQLQDAINSFYDSSKSMQRNAPPGIKQLLERKEGLFRKHMMGKRVNYCCRSVISPDPFLSSDEIGMPLRFAKGLSYPEPVTPHNVESLRKAVENGPNVWPGANYVEIQPGRRIQLDRGPEEKRRALAKQLLTRPGQKVGRHLLDRDYVLVNRQPTLHRPGIMAHKVKVLQAASLADHQTLRMHYANCNAYNADFDGDEINIHFPQNELARAESAYLAATREHYIVPTSGKPLRGLIQDHVDASVKLSLPDCFFAKDIFCSMLYEATRVVVGNGGRVDLEIAGLVPCVVHPERLYSGKQLLQTVVNHVTRKFAKATAAATGLDDSNNNTHSSKKKKKSSRKKSSRFFPAAEKNDWFIRDYEAKAKVSGKLVGEQLAETVVLIRRGHLLRGVLDKAAIGASAMGLVHVVYEIYGPSAAATLLDAFARLLTIYIRDVAGHTCGIGDLVLTEKAEAERAALIEASEAQGLDAFDAFADEFFKDAAERPRTRADAFAAIRAVDGGHERLDSHMQSALAPIHSAIVKACLPHGLRTKYLQNSFTLMVSTGAKGSTVNQSQISCALGQQSLEGRRVPLTATGQALPCFEPYDPSPRAAGFITDRFLSGIRPQEYYFHCMAGREGLVDTAVKTSRSGYLQRCLVKHLEDLVVAYDHTVRDSEGSVIQFLYGDDGLDSTKVALLQGSASGLDFLRKNRPRADDTDAQLQARLTACVDAEALALAQRSASLAVAAEDGISVVGARVLVRRPLRPGNKRAWTRRDVARDLSYGTVVRVRKKRRAVDVRLDADGLLVEKMPLYCVDDDGGPLKSAPLVKRLAEREPYAQRLPAWTPGAVTQALADLLEREGIAEKDPALLAYVYRRYSAALAAPGEAVGAIAAQSIGEPSTQMTLNTFHLAGHGAGNVTLGIPRLREIIMTAAREIKTPVIALPYAARADTNGHDPCANRRRALATRLNRISLDQVRDRTAGVKVVETIFLHKSTLYRSYSATFRLLPAAKIWGFLGNPPEAFDSVAFLNHLAENSRATLVVRLRRHLVQLYTREARDRELAAAKLRAAADRRTKLLERQQNERAGLERADDADGAENTALDLGDDVDDDAVDEADERDEELVGAGSAARKLEKDGYDDEEEDDDDDEVPAPGENEVPPLDYETDEEEARGRASVTPSRKRASVKVEVETKDDDATGALEVTVITTVNAGQRRLNAATTLLNILPACVLRQASAGVRRAVAVDDRLVDGEKRGAVVVEGRDFRALWAATDGAADGLDLNHIESNDIAAVLTVYGVEAARATIVREISGVFAIYGISVGYRHLGLIADYMTYLGGYRALNRQTMQYSSSPYLQMSFETTAAFMTNAALAGASDALASPSASIVVGQPSKIGTNVFDVLVPLAPQDHSRRLITSSEPATALDDTTDHQPSS